MRTLPADCLPVSRLPFLLEDLSLRELALQVNELTGLREAFIQTGHLDSDLVSHCLVCIADLNRLQRKAEAILYHLRYTPRAKLAAARLVNYTLHAIAGGQRLDGLTSWIDLCSLYTGRLGHVEARRRRHRTSTDFL